MTDNQELASLTIKDLRQLAGEHHIQNRSRLGKDDLIQALQGVLSGKLAANAAGGEATAAQPAIAPVAAPAPAAEAAPAAEPEVLSPVAEPEVISPATVAPLGRAEAEPEVLDAAAVAGLAQPGTPGAEGERRGRRRRRRRGRGRGRRDGEAGFDQGAGGDAPGSRPYEGDERDDEGDDEAEGVDGEAAAQPAAPGAQPQQPPREPRPLQPVAGQQDRGDQQHRGDHGRGGDPRRDQPRGGDPRRDQPRNDQRRDDPRRDQGRGGEQRSHEQRPGDQRQGGDHGRGDQRQGGGPRPNGNGNGDGRPHGDGRQGGDGRNDPRSPRPRMEGLLRPMSSVLDRLCVFTKGVLELCDPSTPTWAQARLSELLAETGVVPMPALGLPHPDFHQVIGTAVAKDVPPGHIAVVEAPGFALRGDRGDLFPLRKAQVRIAAGERRDGAPAAPVAPAAEQREPAPAASAPAAAVAQPAPLADVPQIITESGVQPPASRIDEVGEAIPDPKAPSAAPPRPTTTAPADRAAPLLLDPESEGPVVHRHDSRFDHDRPQRRDGQPRRDEQPRQEARRDEPRREHGRRDEPRREERGERPPQREPAGDAPPLPLATQDPDELATKPKAEGFRALGLNDQILADLAAIGYAQPTPIQAEAIPPVLAGKDLLGQAQTGTGKTAAFALPILQRLYSLTAPDRKPSALVLCPTRELARQVYNEFTRMAGSSGARAVVIYGGTPMDDQCRALDRHPHVVIGTPGRIIDHMKRRTLDLSQLAMMVLDEADQMLDIGFWPDVNYIISHTPPARQVLLFSATFPEPVKEMAQKHMKSPEHIRITPKVVTVEQVDQKFIAVPRERKNELLAHFIETQKPEQLVVFCKTKHQTDRVAEVLKRKHMSAAAIHGDLPQSKRERTLQSFRNGELQCLIATNVAARGLDIPTVSHVLNYDIPEAPEEYVHRIGRTARNGAKGVARTFITSEDGQFLLEIEKHIGLLLEEEKIEGFETAPQPEIKRTIAELPAGSPRILKPLAGGIRLGRRRR